MTAISQIPIFITGVENTGSSIIENIIHLCGAFTGTTTGRIENRKIKSLVNWFYKSNGLDQRGQFPLPDCQDISVPNHWKSMIEDILEEEKYYSGSRLWIYRSLRIAQLWPLWNHSFPRAKWIIVKGRLGRIIQTCLSSNYMNAFTNKEIQEAVKVTNEADGWRWWIHQHEKRFLEMTEAGVDYRIIYADKIAEGDYRELEETVKWLGLKWNPEVMNLTDPLSVNDLKT